MLLRGQVDIGRNIRFFRKQAGLRQSDLAHKAGVCHGTISNYEKNKTAPDTYTMLKIAAGLGISVEEILTRTWR